MFFRLGNNTTLGVNSNFVHLWNIVFLKSSMSGFLLSDFEMAEKVEYLAPFKSNVLTSWITLFWKANPVIHLKNAHRTRKAHVLLEIRSPFAAYIQLQRIVNWIQDLWPWICKHFTAFQMLRNWIYLTKVFLPSIQSKGLGNKKVIIMAIRGVL